MPASLLRPLTASEIRCPAGDLLGDAACHCAIEAQTIDGHLSPDTLTAFCAGDYTACTTWQAEKTRIEEGKPSFVAESAAKRERVFSQRQVRQQRLVKAQELMASNTLEARRFRRRLGLVDRVPSGF